MPSRDLIHLYADYVASRVKDNWWGEDTSDPTVISRWIYGLVHDALDDFQQDCYNQYNDIITKAIEEAAEATEPKRCP